MSETPAQTKSLTLPPRPNLGPEPWSRPNPAPGLVASFGFALLIFGFLVLRIARGRRRRRTKTLLVIVEKKTGADSAPWSERVRELLAARFGPSWNAKTSEELLDAAELVSLLDSERLERLTRLMLSADRARFASIADPVPVEERRAAIEDLERILNLSTSSTTARSRSNNK